MGGATPWWQYAGIGLGVGTFAGLAAGGLITYLAARKGWVFNPYALIASTGVQGGLAGTAVGVGTYVVREHILEP